MANSIIKNFCKVENVQVNERESASIANYDFAFVMCRCGPYNANAFIPVKPMLNKSNGGGGFYRSVTNYAMTFNVTTSGHVILTEFWYEGVNHTTDATLTVYGYKLGGGKFKVTSQRSTARWAA